MHFWLEHIHHEAILLEHKSLAALHHKQAALANRLHDLCCLGMFMCLVNYNASQDRWGSAIESPLNCASSLVEKAHVVKEQRNISDK